MNTREQHLRQELRAVENERAAVNTLLTGGTLTLHEQANYQAQVEVLERRQRVLQHLLSCP